MSQEYSEAVEVAREYYNSEDADNFYATIWGGEDLHIGTYQDESESIREASTRTVAQMTEKLDLKPEHKVMDIGAGYAGSARYMVEHYGCYVDALNLSEKENERGRQINAERGLTDKITVIDGSFDAIPGDADQYDVVWSQDAMLHSDDRAGVLREVDRVIKPGGKFIFTDPMQADDCPTDVLQPIYDRLHLSSLGSPAFYRQQLEDLGFREISFDERTDMLAMHYSRVLQETERREEDLRKVVSQDYIDRMKKGLNHWIQGGRNGHLCWGIFLFEKVA